MILCIIEAAAAVIWLIFGIRKGMEGSSRMAPKILLVTAVLGIFLAVRAQNTHVINDEDQIARKNPGQGQRTETLEVSIPELGQKEEYTAVISERQLTAAEKEEVFERAKEEAEQIFIGKNDSVDAVRDTVVLPATLADGLVEAEWSFDNYEVMQPDGSIIEDAVPEDGVEVQAKLQMTCQESMGILDGSLAHPREILKTAILSNAAQILILHNHPSNELKPSRYDIQITDRMQKACDLIGIPLADHIILGRDNYFSFRQNEILPLDKVSYAERIEDIQFANSKVAENGKTSILEKMKDKQKTVEINSREKGVRTKDVQSIL